MVCEFAEITGSGKLKRAKAVGDILEHYSEHSPQTKAELVSKIIDKEGTNFGKNVFKNSKVLKEMNQLNPEKTSGVMVTTRSSLYLLRQSRTAFKKELGFCPISSQVFFNFSRILEECHNSSHCQNRNPSSSSSLPSRLFCLLSDEVPTDNKQADFEALSRPPVSFFP